MRNVVALYTAVISAVVRGAQVSFPSLDLSSLGHVAVAGQFSGISLYSDTLQTAVQSTGSRDGLFVRQSDGVYVSLGETDGLIYALCALNNDAIYVGGNFSTIGNVSALNVAAYAPSTNTFSALSTGVLGTVNALYCANSTSQVYIGGTFDISNATNVIVWDAASRQFESPAFEGLDGTVNTIQADGDSLLFGGQFDAVAGETSSSLNEPQQVNLQTAYITSENSYTAIAGFSDPNNIICPSGQDVAGDVWLLSDNQAGSWSAAANFTFRPSSFKIYNTHYGGRGTREFRFVAQPINGILNLTYVDPSTGAQAYCDARCPLSNSTSVEYQEFRFVNQIEMNAFSLDISGWYGAGGGLRGFELFTEEIYAYAVTAYNEPTCANGTFTSTSSAVGSWTTTVIGAEPGFLSANLSGSALSDDSVTFEPQLNQRGNYSIRIYTPGCLLDNTCSTRGGVTLSVYAQDEADATNVTIFQTNDYDKYDTIYQGLVDPASSSFRPRVVLRPLAGQSGTINTVASRVQYLELSSTGSTNLNGLFQYNSTTYSGSSSNNSTLDLATAGLDFDAVVTSIVVGSSTTYVAGNFSGAGIANVLQVSGGSATSLASSGLDGPVTSMLLANGLLYIGGNFTSLVNSTTSAEHVVAYNISAGSWTALGGGLNGPVVYIFETSGLIGISGSFSATNAYTNAQARRADGTAYWDPAKLQWTSSAGYIDGTVRASLTSNSSLYLAGEVLSTYQTAAQSVAGLNVSASSQVVSAVSLPFSTTSTSAIFDVNTGAFYNSSTKSLTIIAGQFSTLDSSGSTINDVAFIMSNGTVYGLPSGRLSNTSIIYSSHVVDQRILFGGALTGTSGSSTLGGLFIYDLESSALDSTQPAALQGTNVQVNSITTRPGVAQIVVAGNFDSAGSLTCPSLCVLDTATTTWQRPAIGLSGNVSSSTWLGQNILLLAGNMTLNGTTQYLATFDFSTQSFSAVTTSLLPGPAAVAVSDTNSTSSIFVAGQTTSGTAYLAKWNGNSTDDLSSGLSAGSVIYDLQFVPLSKKTTNSILGSSRDLLVLGNLTLGTNGTVSGALFDGTTYNPYILTSTANDQPGVIKTFFSEQLISFASSGSKLSRGVVVVIALAIALFITFLIVACGILAAFVQRRRQGYRPANQTMPEKSNNAVPPQSLFGDDNFQSHKGRAPKI